MSGKEFIKRAEKIGWHVERIRGSHHMMKHSKKKGMLVVPVHGKKDLKIGLLKRLMKDAGL